MSFYPELENLDLAGSLDYWYGEPLEGAIEELIRQEAKKAKTEVLKLRFHNCPYVGGSVLRFMSKLYPREARSLLLESLQDSHYIVKESAIDEIDELNLVEAIPVLRPLLNDSSIEVRQAAETAIKNLASYIES